MDKAPCEEEVVRINEAIVGDGPRTNSRVVSSCKFLEVLPSIFFHLSILLFTPFNNAPHPP